jgi:septum formation protein
LIPPRIILASTSPYRRALLERLRLPFEVRAPAVDETPLASEQPRTTALRLAQAKARDVASHYPQALVIGSDQVAALDGTAIGKPGGHAQAVAQLKAMRARSVIFHTALAVLNTTTGTIGSVEVPTTVSFRDYTDAEVERYLRLEQPYDCAGSAKIEGQGIVLVERVSSDDPTALIGLPLIALADMLRANGIPLV